MREFASDLQRAWSWAAARNFAGYDPYDALRSPLLFNMEAMLGRPFGIAATQILRRSPVDFRPLLGIKPAANAKALGLFLAAAARTGDKEATRALADRLRTMQCPEWDVPCWGYPFPWRARAFYLPEGTPTIVATSFVAEGFLDACALLGESRDLETALGACRFVLERLHRTEDATGACLSYSPLDRSAVYNASILGARLLIRAGLASNRRDLLDQAGPLVRFVLARQREDGSWPYGEASFHRWSDSFHTGFILAALDVYGQACRDSRVSDAVARGARLYTDRFFGADGEPYYFSDKQRPYDVHSAAQGVITLAQLGEREPRYAMLAERVGGYLVDHFLARDGHFRYQLRRTHAVSIPYMRWSQAWGIRALAALVERGVR